MCMYVWIYVCVYAWMYVCVYIWMYVWMYVSSMYWKSTLIHGKCLQAIKTNRGDLWRLDATSLELKRLDYAELKRNLRKRTIRGVPGDVNSWKCETCGRALLSKAGYVNHVKSHVSSQAHVIHGSLPSRPQGHICLMCNKVCKSAPGLKRYIVVHKDLIG